MIARSADLSADDDVQNASDSSERLFARIENSKTLARGLKRIKTHCSNHKNVLRTFLAKVYGGRLNAASYRNGACSNRALTSSRAQPGFKTSALRLKGHYLSQRC